MKIESFYNGTAWPIPEWWECDEKDSLEWTLRYGSPSKSDLLRAASVCAAYRRLITSTQRERNVHCQNIKGAMKRGFPMTPRKTMPILRRKK